MSERAWIPLLLLLGFFGACAIPQMPTGGPVDEIPPRLVETTPVNESVNVSENRVSLTFSEYIDQASFAQAVSVTPEFDRPLKFRWRKQRVDITFPDTLRPNTTYLLTIDTNLRDANRVALKSPITLAFASGPRINKGQLAGRVLDPERGKGVAGVDLFAYARPDSTLPGSFPDAPSYRTQTDPQGQFRFTYLSEQPYFIAALKDENRNKKPDGIEPYGVPPEPIFFADTLQADSTQIWFLTSQDTIPPRAQRVRPLSSRRFLIQFSEAVQFDSVDTDRWVLSDSASGDRFDVASIYQTHQDPRSIYFATPVLFATTHALIPNGLSDSTGNALRPDTLYFRPSTSTDTLQARFIRWEPEGLSTGEAGHPVLPPGALPGFRLSIPLDSLQLSAIVTAQDTAGTPVPVELLSLDGTKIEIAPTPMASPGAIIRLSLAGAGLSAPDTTYTRTFQFISDENLGELGGIVSSADSNSVRAVELIPAGTAALGPRRSLSPIDSTFLFGQLPAGQAYRFRAFLDSNGNGSWDGGLLLPYLKPEPLTWSQDSIAVRARWETTLSDTLRIPDAL